MKKPAAASLILLAFALAACSSFAQPTPTAAPTSTFTAIPISTATSMLTNTPLPPSATPEGQSASEWNGIPVMPDAIAGDGDEESYVFTIKATLQQIQEYYQLELGKLGWQPFAQEDGDSSLTLIFMNDASETLTVSIIAKGDEALVLLVK